MMAANYRHIGCLENRLGRHYSRFSASGPAAPLAAQSLARRKSPNHGSNRRSQVRVRVCQRFSDERFGMTALVDASADSQAAYRLQSRIGPRRHRLIWSLSSDERDVLDHVLRASDQPITDGILDAELTRIVELMRSRIAVAGSDRSGRNPPRSSPEDADIFEMLVQRWHEQNDVFPLCQKEIPLRTENKLLQMSPDRMDSSDIHYDWPNTRLTHLACNLGKSDATLDEWWAYLGMIRQTS